MERSTRARAQQTRQDLKTAIVTVGWDPGGKRLGPGHAKAGGQENKKEEKFNTGMNHSVGCVCR